MSIALLTSACGRNNGASQAVDWAPVRLAIGRRMFSGQARQERGIDPVGAQEKAVMADWPDGEDGGDILQGSFSQVMAITWYNIPRRVLQIIE
jgi:hypothetical protein